ncbi:hypothetical protein M5D96_007380 [Drosophila gunungcola]|uniref:Uncharacterized protein n=1 Tax=Drosophila gunungcola TaxID=103775 RepID=A0A9P9YMW4_9MUSC|nr:hypothetical protein M5D96_007380 [Drosophila gunungcola]
MKIMLVIISLPVHHVVLVCAAAFELRVRLVVTDLARSLHCHQCHHRLPVTPDPYINPDPSIQFREESLSLNLRI